MTLHHAGEARGRKKKNNFTELALNIRRQSGKSGQQMVVKTAGGRE